MALTKTALFALAMLFFSVSALGYCMFKQSEDLKRYVLVLTKKVVSLQEQIKEYQIACKKIKSIPPPRKMKKQKNSDDEEEEEEEKHHKKKKKNNYDDEDECPCDE